MTSTAWLLLALALLCWPGPRPAGPGEGHTGPRRRHRRTRRAERSGQRRTAEPDHTQRLAGVGALAAGGLAVALFGWPALPLAILAAPVVAHVLARVPHRRAGAADLGLPLALDLTAAALHSGQPLSQALQLGAPVAATPTALALNRVASLLELGTDPVVAWRGVDVPALGPVAAAGCRSADSGARLAAGFEQVADDLRRAARAAAVGRGQRAGVLALAPLGLCFLPAFVCLGVVPVVIGVATGAFSGAG